MILLRQYESLSTENRDNWGRGQQWSHLNFVVFERPVIFKKTCSNHLKHFIHIWSSGFFLGVILKWRHAYFGTFDTQITQSCLIKDKNMFQYSMMTPLMNDPFCVVFNTTLSLLQLFFFVRNEQPIFHLLSGTNPIKELNLEIFLTACYFNLN